MTARAAAVLSDGTRIVAAMDRRVAAAWALWHGDVLIASGFSRDDGLARQAARKHRNQLTGRALYNAARRRFRYGAAAQELYAAQHRKYGGFARWNGTIADAERGYWIEIVAVERD